jgi:hypothetical protein
VTQISAHLFVVLLRSVRSPRLQNPRLPSTTCSAPGLVHGPEMLLALDSTVLAIDGGRIHLLQALLLRAMAVSVVPVALGPGPWLSVPSLAEITLRNRA